MARRMVRLVPGMKTARYCSWISQPAPETGRGIIMKKLLAIVLTLVLSSTIAFNVNAIEITCSTLDGAYVYSAEDTPVYLGFFGTAGHPESIMNFSGQYGSSSGTYSVRNILGRYGSTSGQYSANNPLILEVDPPEIFKNGAYVSDLSTAGYLGSVSLAEIDSICSSFTSNSPPSIDSADLAITFFDAHNGVYTPDDTIPVTAKIENIGGKTSLSYRFTVYASKDENITLEDYGRYWELEALGVGEFHYYTFQSSLPAYLANGEYYIGAIVTVDDDSNYDNNSSYDSTPITISGSSSPAFKINSGLNDAWYNPATDGQGFYIAVLPDVGLVSLAWFTYDTTAPQVDVHANLGSANHRWLTALGPINGNQVVMDIEITSGGLFDTGSPIQRTSDGIITLTFDDCYSGTIDYDITSINQQGSVPIQRAANDNVALCEALSSD